MMSSKMLLSMVYRHREVHVLKNINRKTHKVVVCFMEHNGGFQKCYVTNDYPHQTFAV